MMFAIYVLPRPPENCLLWLLLLLLVPTNSSNILLFILCTSPYFTIYLFFLAAVNVKWSKRCTYYLEGKRTRIDVVPKKKQIKFENYKNQPSWLKIEPSNVCFFTECVFFSVHKIWKCKCKNIEVISHNEIDLVNHLANENREATKNVPKSFHSFIQFCMFSYFTYATKRMLYSMCQCHMSHRMWCIFCFFFLFF